MEYEDGRASLSESSSVFQRKESSLKAGDFDRGKMRSHDRHEIVA
jgi:hypothetical protein